MISETTRCIVPLSTPLGKGALREEGSLRVEWARVDDGSILTITPQMKCTIAVDGIEHLRYECTAETRFTVNSFGGFDPTVALPVDATVPYVDMALWLARAHVTNAIREAGIPSFAYTRPASAQKIIEEQVKDEQVAPKVTKRRSSKLVAGMAAAKAGGMGEPVKEKPVKVAGSKVPSPRAAKPVVKKVPK